MSFSSINIQSLLNAISMGNHVLNESAIFYRNTKTICTTCTFDPIRKESTNPNCPTCGGTGYIVTIVPTTIPVTVEQAGDYTSTYENVGQLTKGQIRLTVDKVELATINTNPVYDFTQEGAMKGFSESFDYVIWNSDKFFIESYEAGWLEGNLYEIAFTCKLIE